MPGWGGARWRGAGGALGRAPGAPSPRELGELVLPAAQLLEEAAHDHDRRGVGARDLEAGIEALFELDLAVERDGVDAAEADLRRRAIDPRGLGGAERVGERRGEGVEIA